MQCTVGVGLLGCGTVGANVAQRLIQERDALERRSGVRYELRAIGIRDQRKKRPHSIDASLFTSDARSVVEDPHVDIVVECIGGTTDAGEFIERALDRGRHVVTANKDLLATQGPRLHALAAARRVELRYEAAACGAVPVIRTLSDALAGDRVERLAGVINGTSTFIISTMENGAVFSEALQEAQLKGYAEADPSNDVDGKDASHKLALLIQLAFNLAVISPRIHHEGISSIAQADIDRAKRLGLKFRLVAAAMRTANGAAAGVAPVLLPEDHPFAQTYGAENVVQLAARDAGTLTLRGPGAGGPATASAVLGDIVSALRAIGERHDLASRAQSRALEPALDVSPLFSQFPRHSEFPRFPLWDNRSFEPSHSNAPASPAMA